MLELSHGVDNEATLVMFTLDRPSKATFMITQIQRYLLRGTEYDLGYVSIILGRKEER